MRKLFIIGSIFISTLLSAQIGGNGVFQFLNLPNSARTTAMGGYLMNIYDDDVNTPFNNPSLLNPKMHNHASLSYIDWFSDVKYGYASYARSYDKIGNFYAGMQYVNYGKFDAADETGNITGTFTGGDYCLALGYSREFFDSVLTVGVNLKGIVSKMESYGSSGLSTDIGATYHNDEKKFTASLLFRNLGTQLNPYSTKYERMPIDIQLGISKGFKHLPFRFSLIFHDLQKFNYAYIDTVRLPSTDPLTGETVERKISGIDKFMRHVVIGGEFTPAKFLSFRFAYNYQRRKEMALDTKKGTVGLSWGLGIKISKIKIEYGRAAYHLAGSPNHITLSTNLSEWVKK
jgi:hypothetical protein